MSGDPAHLQGCWIGYHHWVGDECDVCGLRVDPRPSKRTASEQGHGEGP